MSMEKRGVVDENTPPRCGCACRCKQPTEPLTKESADQMDGHFATDLTDAVADQTDKNRKG